MSEEKRLRVHTAKFHLLQKHAAWRCVAGIWLGIALFSASQTVFVMQTEYMHHAWIALFFFKLVSWLSATPCASELSRRHPLTAKRALPWVVHIVAGVAISAASAAWLALLESSLDPWLEASSPSHSRVFGMEISIADRWLT